MNRVKTDAAMLDRYLQQLDVRKHTTTLVYRSILKGFQHFVATHSHGEPISMAVIQKWLRDQATVWSLPVVLHHARLVDRFLDWMEAMRSLESNPLAELRKQYEQRTTGPIVRALLGSDSAAALEQLRPPPRFGSFLGPTMRNHVALMRALGYRYDTCERSLLRFDRFLQRRVDLTNQSLNVLLMEWSHATPTVQHTLECHQVGRVLSKALRRIDPIVAHVPSDRHLYRLARSLHRHPYVYSEEEVRRLLETARNFPSPQSPLRPLTIYIMLVLAYCAGLRLGEIVRLNVGDVLLDDETIEIRNTKFFKSRRLPLAPSVISALRHYLDARRQVGASVEPSSGLFWQSRTSGRYSYMTAGQLLRRVLRRAGLKPGKGRTGPRIHDLRHAFVANRMLAWYRQGINPQPHLPHLATYLGHKDITSTLVYLTVTPELLQEAGQRFRVRGAQIIRASRRGNI
jgi:integrase